MLFNWEKFIIQGINSVSKIVYSKIERLFKLCLYIIWSNLSILKCIDLSDFPIKSDLIWSHYARVGNVQIKIHVWLSQKMLDPLGISLLGCFNYQSINLALWVKITLGDQLTMAQVGWSQSEPWFKPSKFSKKKMMRILEKIMISNKKFLLYKLSCELGSIFMVILADSFYFVMVMALSVLTPSSSYFPFLIFLFPPVFFAPHPIFCQSKYIWGRLVFHYSFFFF